MNLKAEPFYPEDDEDLGPGYEAEDIGCSCNDSGIESEWEWSPSNQAYICTGCGEIQ